MEFSTIVNFPEHNKNLQTEINDESKYWITRQACRFLSMPVGTLATAYKIIEVFVRIGYLIPIRGEETMGQRFRLFTNAFGELLIHTVSTVVSIANAATLGTGPFDRIQRYLFTIPSTLENLKTAEDKLKTAEDKLKTAEDKLKTAENKLKTAENELELAKENNHKVRNLSKLKGAFFEKIAQESEKLKTKLKETEQKLKETEQKLEETEQFYRNFSMMTI